MNGSESSRGLGIGAEYWILCGAGGCRSAIAAGFDFFDVLGFGSRWFDRFVSRWLVRLLVM